MQHKKPRYVGEHVPIRPTPKPDPPYPNCEHRHDNECDIATLIANEPVQVRSIHCLGCLACPTRVNDITKQLAIEINPTLSTPERGVGSRLGKVISWFISQPRNCNCPDRIEIMNMWGPELCRTNKSTILGWLRESALDNDYPYSELFISGLLSVIISVSERLDY